MWRWQFKIKHACCCRAYLGLDPEGDGQEPAELDRLTGSVSWPGGPGEQPPASSSSTAAAGGFDAGSLAKLQLSRLAAASLPFACSSAPGSPMAHARKSGAFADSPSECCPSGPPCVVIIIAALCFRGSAATVGGSNWFSPVDCGGLLAVCKYRHASTSKFGASLHLEHSCHD